MKTNAEMRMRLVALMAALFLNGTNLFAARDMELEVDNSSLCEVPLVFGIAMLLLMAFTMYVNYKKSKARRQELKLYQYNGPALTDVELRETPCNLMCRRAMRAIEGRCSKGVNIYFTTDVPDTCTIRTDAERAEALLVRFLTNSCKYTDKGDIHLHCSEQENPGHITFIVTDSGISLDIFHSICERLMGAFSTVKSKGLALGHYSALASKLGGQLLWDDSYASGSRISFTF